MASDKRRTPDEDRPLKKVKFSPQISITEFLAIPAKEAVTFHLLYGNTSAELDAKIRAGGVPFSCEFYNQVFGDSEEIKGYKGLEVHVWIALRSGHCWVNISFKESKPGADDVQGLLAAWWPKPFSTDRAAFLQQASAAPALDFSTLGTCLSSSIAQGVGVDPSTLQLYHATLADTPDWFKELHARLEPLLIFTIDGANFIDITDRKWEVVAAVIQRNGHSYLAGFMTLYNFYAWPYSQRPRVAQVLVLPTLQRCGYGRALIAAAYHLARQREAIDLTFEDPAPGLQLLREKLELEMMDACDWLTAPATQALAAAGDIEKKLQDAARQLWASKGNKQQQAPGQNAAEAPAVAAAPPAAAAAAGGGVISSSSNGVEQQVVVPESPASKLVMPHGLQQRVTKELKIHKHQVLSVWEALLFLHSPLGERPSGPVEAADVQLLLDEPLTEFVTSRLESGAAAPADKAAANKKMVKVEGTDDDWFVYKLPKKQQKPAQDDDELLSDTVSVGRHTITKVSADEHSERLQELVSKRMETLALLKRRVRARRAKQQSTPQLSAVGS